MRERSRQSGRRLDDALVAQIERYMAVKGKSLPVDPLADCGDNVEPAPKQ
jgi:hypothetical protein